MIADEPIYSVTSKITTTRNRFPIFAYMYEYRCSQRPVIVNAQIQPQINAKADANRSGTVDFDPFALIRVCLCGKRFPNDRIRSM